MMSPSSEDLLISALKPLNVSVDSHVTIARQGSNIKHVMLQNVYSIKAGLSLIFTPPCYWSPRQPMPLTSRRDNYGGIALNAATVVSKG
jgi:hypothetical protein